MSEILLYMSGKELTFFKSFGTQEKEMQLAC